MTGNSETILIFGGTFDPPHRAHVELPPLVARQIGASRILYVPAALNPLKVDSPPTDAQHRLEMLKRAVADLPNAEVATLELQREGPSYTVETLEQLRERFGQEADLRLLIGADQAVEFHRWKDWQRILQLARPVVMLRPPWNREHFRAELAEHYDDEQVQQWLEHTIDVPAINVSSTQLRHRMETNGDLSDMLPSEVARYVREHELYQRR